MGLWMWHLIMIYRSFDLRCLGDMVYIFLIALLSIFEAHISHLEYVLKDSSGLCGLVSVSKYLEWSTS